jgi:hypothetical protein
MKKYWIFFLSLSISNIFAQDLYNTNSLANIEITFTQSNWDQILDTYYTNGNDERLLGSVLINGESYDSVGVKYKGNSTFNVGNAKNPLNIKLDEIIPQNYQGFSVLKLSNGDKDPSFVREVLGYDIARKYMDVPQASYAKVYINGTYIGLYSNIESINNDFQEKYLYANRDASRIKCNPVNVQNGGSSLAYLGANESSYYNYYELETDTGWSDLMNLCNITDNAPSLLEDFLDIDRAIWMLAYNNVMVNLDSYTGPFKQNYYLIKAKHDDMIPILWDLNMTMGGFGMINSGPGGGGANLAEMSLLLRQNETAWPLLNAILQNDRYRKMYIAHCKTIYEENIAGNEYYEQAQNLQATISTALSSDNNAFYTFTEAQSNLTTTITENGGGGPGPGQSFIGLKELFDERKVYLESTSQFSAIAPTITEVNFENYVLFNTQLIVNATVSNTSDVLLGYREFSGDRFVKVAMKDDGLLDDAAAGDGIYTYTIPMNASDVQFYIYAENANAGIFSPARAEHEFYTAATLFDVVLNEIQTSNATTQPDQNGEFQDWIELYNTSENPVDLSNFYLSDKGSELNRWKFPNGTILQPDDYLIVWADADTLQGGLHANFKLSAGGESVYLSNGTIVYDKIKYGYMKQDVTYGRYPNGIGTLKILTATFDANNGDGSVGIKDSKEVNESFILYPNPSTSSFQILMKTDTLANVEIYDSMGRKIYNGNSTFIRTENWSKGIYWVKIGNQSKKIIVQ